jgi:hypothetical protein
MIRWAAFAHDIFTQRLPTLVRNDGACRYRSARDSSNDGSGNGITAEAARGAASARAAIEAAKIRMSIVISNDKVSRSALL